MPSELTPGQEQAINRVIRRRSEIEAARRRTEHAVYTAVRRHNIPVRVLAGRLGLSRQRIYQMVHNVERILDQ